MTKSKDKWQDDGKYYASELVSSFTLREGYLRISYSPTTSYAPGSITFSRETTDPTSYCTEVGAGDFVELREKVMAMLQQMLESKAGEELPWIECQVPSSDDEYEEDDDEYEEDDE